jgi:ferric-dicitrate binding protein FerR (iron transport regulator)
MEKQKAIEIIEQALNAANLKGVYTLKDVELILKAFEELKK